MRFRLIRLRFRRRLRKGQRQVEDFGTQAEEHIDKHLFRRFERLSEVKRFVASWVVLVLLLISGLIYQNLNLSNYFQTLKPVPGGIYNEGVLGTFTNANPLFATTDADTTVSTLVFAGLFKYNSQNQLVGDLAKSYSYDEPTSTYTVKLRPGLTWHDGQPLTSEDVLYTYQMIQNPDTQSPLQASWRGVEVAARDPLTVTFKLPNQLASFPYNMTNGIVPKHILGKIEPSGLRSADFNTAKPVGSGPFAWQTVQVSGSDPAKVQEQIGLVAFDKYYAGKPKLRDFNVHVYANKDDLIKDFTKKQLTAAEGLTDLPDSIEHMSGAQQHNLLLTAATMVFFKNSSGVLSDQNVRQALVRGADTTEINRQLGYPTRPVMEPLLVGQLAFDPAYAQPKSNPDQARKILNKAGWVVGENGIRKKGGQQLSFSLSASNTEENRRTMSLLKKQWQDIGVTMRPQLQDAADFHNTLSFHNYDAVLHGISIGVDPDVFVYWDSAQADVRSSNRLNLSEYKNPKADASLEAGRTRTDPLVRTVKYKPFLKAWQQDAPALGLYQPRLLYITNVNVDGLMEHSLNSAANRFNNVNNWQIRLAKVTNE